VREKHPFDGPLVVSVDGQDRTIGEKVARQILVRPASAASPEQAEPPTRAPDVSPDRQDGAAPSSPNLKRRKEPSDHATRR
jgi:hypothetical protein